MKPIRLASGYMVILCGSVLLTGCVDVQVGRSFQSAGVSDLEVGTTTKAQVIQLFGPPTDSIISANLPGVRFGDDEAAVTWSYIYGQADILQGTARCLQTEFNQAGILVNYGFTSNFQEDRTPAVARETDFDLLDARTHIVSGKTDQAEVRSLIGTNYVVLQFKKPDIAQRWHYEYSVKSKTEKITVLGQTIPKTFGKSLDIDFDVNDIVQHVTGASDFPEDAVQRQQH